MEDYLFHDGPVPPGYTREFETSLFNRPAHLQLQAPEGWHSFYLLNEKHHTCDASVHFHIAQGVARSPLKSPFGSVEFAEGLAPITLFRFLEFVESRLRARGAATIVIKHPPAGYHSAHSALLHTFYFNLGYQGKDAEAGTLLHLTPAAFETHLDTWEKRKLRQAAEAGLVFREMTLTRLEEIYGFILDCRKEKGYSLSMSLPALKETARVFVNDFLLFGIFRNEQLIAASISIRIKKHILYNFYSAHAQEADPLSPVVFLIERMYAYGQQNNITLLDLGTSALEGKPNFGLLDFKMRLGGLPSLKLTFEKTFA